MTKLIDTLYTGFIRTVKFVRVPAFITAATRDESAHFCRYNRLSEDIIIK